MFEFPLANNYIKCYSKVTPKQTNVHIFEAA